MRNEATNLYSPCLICYNHINRVGEGFCRNFCQRGYLGCLHFEDCDLNSGSYGLAQNSSITVILEKIGCRHSHSAVCDRNKLHIVSTFESPWGHVEPISTELYVDSDLASKFMVCFSIPVSVYNSRSVRRFSFSDRYSNTARDTSVRTPTGRLDHFMCLVAWRSRWKATTHLATIRYVKALFPNASTNSWWHARFSSGEGPLGCAIAVPLWSLPLLVQEPQRGRPLHNGV